MIQAYTYQNLTDRDTFIFIFLIKKQQLNANQKLRELFLIHELKEKAIQRKENKKKQMAKIRAMELDQLDKEMSDLLKMIDNDLQQSGSRYVVGNKFTYADVIAIAIIGRVLFIRGDKVLSPNLKVFWQYMKERECFKKSNIIYRYEDCITCKNLPLFKN